MLGRKRNMGVHVTVITWLNSDKRLVNDMGHYYRNDLSIKFQQLSWADIGFDYQMMFSWSSVPYLIAKGCSGFVVKKKTILNSCVLCHLRVSCREPGGRTGHNTKQSDINNYMLSPHGRDNKFGNFELLWALTTKNYGGQWSQIDSLWPLNCSRLIHNEIKCKNTASKF